MKSRRTQRSWKRDTDVEAIWKNRLGELAGSCIREVETEGKLEQDWQERTTCVLCNVNVASNSRHTDVSDCQEFSISTKVVYWRLLRRQPVIRRSCQDVLAFTLPAGNLLQLHIFNELKIFYRRDWHKGADLCRLHRLIPVSHNSFDLSFLTCIKKHDFFL